MGQSKFSYELTFWFILIKNSGKQKSKNTLRVEINQSCDGKRDTMRRSCAIDKMGGVVTPPTSRKVGVVLLGIIFLNTELNKPQFLSDEMLFVHCSLQIKQNMYSIGIFRASVVTQSIVKVERKIEKSPIF